MNQDINYENNPLHGVSLKNLLTEIVEHYGFDILYAYLNLNCFKTNAAIDSSVKFLKKTDWAREKVESFYLYEYKCLPLPSAGQLELSPRDRIVPEGQTPGEPAELSLEDAKRLREKRAKKSAAFQADKKPAGSGAASQFKKRGASPKPKSEPSPQPEASKASSPAGKSKTDPWANSRK